MVVTARELPPITERSHDLSVGIVGVGQLGSALWHTLSKAYHTFPLDPALGYGGPDHPLDHLHVCIPFTDAFVDDVLVWIAQYDPILVIIHSTIPPGTTRQVYAAAQSRHLSCHCVASPTMGEHPHLGEHLLTYLKIVGGVPDGATDMAGLALMSAGFRVAVFDAPEAVEWGHLLGLAREGLDVAWTQAVHALCQRDHIPLTQVLYGWTEMENEGRLRLRLLDRIHPLTPPVLDENRSSEVEQALSLLAWRFGQEQAPSPMLDDLQCLIGHGLMTMFPDPGTSSGDTSGLDLRGPIVPH